MNSSKFLIMILFFAFAGCAHVISQDAMQDINRDVSFDMVLKNPDAFIGETLLLGGDILETQPFQGKTLLTVLQRPLGFDNKPRMGRESAGRYIVEAPEFLDPAIYSAGRRITVAGVLVGKEIRPLGNTKYLYPILRRKEIYLWPREADWNGPRFYFGFGLFHGF